MKLQEFYAHSACKEAGLLNPRIAIDHLSGTTVVNGNQYGLIFPKSLITLCKSLWTHRTQDFYFKGVITEKRKWVLLYDNTYESRRGRNQKLKYTPDIDYYSNLAKTKFALAPTGDCNWSYRMFEAILCGAIPVLGDTDTDIFSCDYHVFRHSDKKAYYPEWAEHNHRLLLERITLK